MTNLPGSHDGNNYCRVYWGSHGCMYERGHDGPHECVCAFDETSGERLPKVDAEHFRNVGAPPYYGLETRFYGEEAETLGLPLTGAR